MPTDASGLKNATPIVIVGPGAAGTQAAVSAAGDLTVADGISSGGTQGAVSLVANTALEVKVGASRLSLRKLITFISTDQNVYWGYTSAVTVATGTPLFKNSQGSWNLDPTDPNATVYVVCASAATGRVTETP